VRNGLRARLIGAACAVVSLSVIGCATAPTCQVSPVELEELREDIAVLQKDLKTATDRSAALSADLATKQADLAAKKSKPDELRRRVEEVRRGSGRVEKKSAGDGKKETS